MFPGLVTRCLLHTKLFTESLEAEEAARITCRQARVGPHPNTMSLARGRCKFRADFYFTSDLLQVLTHHFNAHYLNTLSFEKFEAKPVVLCT